MEVPAQARIHATTSGTDVHHPRVIPLGYLTTTNHSHHPKVNAEGGPANTNYHPPPQACEVFGINLTHQRKEIQFVVLTLGVFGFYLMYGYLQELLFTEWRQQGLHLGWFLTLVQFVGYASFSLFQRISEFYPTSTINSVAAATNTATLKSNKITTVLFRLATGSSIPKPRLLLLALQHAITKRAVPIRVYAVIGFWSVATIGLSNASCEFLNYPTQVVFKCCKLIPVMLLGKVILQKTYRLVDYLAAGMFCAGLIVFTLADKAVAPVFDTVGVMLISGALVADAFIGNLQEKAFKQFNASASETLLYVKGLGCLYLIVVTAATQQLTVGVVHCISHPNTLPRIAAFCAAGWIGESFVMTMVKQFGAVVTVTTTSARKVLTIFLSFLIFPKPYTHAYLLGGILIFGAIGLNLPRNNGKGSGSGGSDISNAALASSSLGAKDQKLSA
eukprot:c8336_g1_i1.p1 GENE.c8336_g1_i1~~c8336_g1_i1.p1  ORF type:complete len:446 (-),score=85.10 c8336_g1_i1:1220-2557(-)